MISLHDFVLSGNCYKVRLLMQLLDVPFRTVPVDFYPGRAHKLPAFRELNPLQQLPVLEHGDFVLWDSQAILVYLASRYDPSHQWYPENAKERGLVSQWLAFADGISTAISAARLHDCMFYELDAQGNRQKAHALLRILDRHLWFAEKAGQQWIATPADPSIADIACFPYVALSEEGGIPRDDYPAVRKWLDRVKGLPRFVGMPGIFADLQLMVPEKS